MGTFNKFEPGSEFPVSDLNTITCALADAGLLAADSPPQQVSAAVTEAARRVAGNPDPQVGPSSPADVVRHLRLARSHRVLGMGPAVEQPRVRIKGAMMRAHQRLGAGAGNGLHRALLPPIPPDAFQANRRLATALIAGVDIDGVARAAAETLSRGGKTGFVSVRDFVLVVENLDARLAQLLKNKMKRRLDGIARRRFNKLCRRIPPAERDFDGEP